MTTFEITIVLLVAIVLLLMWLIVLTRNNYRLNQTKELKRQQQVESLLSNLKTIRERSMLFLVWYKRLWMGLKYILGYKCCYGNFEEMILTKKHAYQVYKLWAFLFEKKGDNDE